LRFTAMFAPANDKPTNNGEEAPMTRQALSYVCGSSELPLLGTTIGQHFDEAVARWGDELALVVRQQGVRLTYAELAARVDAFAAGLVALGLRPGDRIGIWSPNNAEWAVAQFATAKAGLILVSGVPAIRAGIRTEQGWLPCADHRHVVQGERLRSDAHHTGPGDGRFEAW
jgi:non-ribosomal peptide synthetase component F